MFKEIKKPLIISISIGFLFGIIFSKYINDLNQSSLSPLITTIIITSITTIFSALSALYALVADKKLRELKIKSELIRRTVSFSIIILSVSLIIYFLSDKLVIFQKLNVPENVSIYVTLFGFLVGFIIMYIDYRNYKREQKILFLEQENKFLSEVAYKDRLYQETTRSLILSEERNRMAQELHDSIAQGMHAINYLVRVLKKQNELTGTSKSLVENIETATNQTLKDLRNVIKELKPSNLEKVGLEKALRAIINLSKDIHGIKYKVNISYNNILTPTQEMAAYRIFQEAISNIERHSEAKNVFISLVEENDAIILKIEDNGSGFDLSKTENGYGLNNIKDRANQTGSSVNILSSKSGTKIICKWIVFD